VLEPISVVRPLLLDLLCQLAYQQGDFVLSSGQRSNYYINCKPVTLHPFGALWTGQVILPLLLPHTEAVGGLTLGADPIVTAVSVVSALTHCPIPGLIVRKQAKGHGTQAWIEGVTLRPDSLVAVLEDVVTTGSSAMQAVTRLREAGYQVKQVVALVDRLQGAKECFVQHGLEFSAVFTIEELRCHCAQRF
jgi:orotate phosphoribosyltransferase